LASARIMIAHSLPPSEFVLTRANWWLIHSPRPGKQRCPTCPTNPCSRITTVKSPLQMSRDLYKTATFVQNKPNPQDPKININSFTTKLYSNYILRYPRKNKPNFRQAPGAPRWRILCGTDPICYTLHAIYKTNPISPAPAPRYTYSTGRMRRRGPLPLLRSSGMMSRVKSQDTKWRFSGWLMACLAPAAGTGKSPPVSHKLQNIPGGLL